MGGFGDLEKARRKANKLGLNGDVRVLVVCMDRKTGKCCRKDEMVDAWDRLKRRTKKWNRDGGGSLLRLKSACLGICAGGPIIGILPEGVWYGNCDEATIDRIFDEHLARGELITENLIAKPR
ncbi:MAG: ferredoxin [Planctomycetota bacterium]